MSAGKPDDLMDFSPRMLDALHKGYESLTAPIDTTGNTTPTSKIDGRRWKN